MKRFILVIFVIALAVGLMACRETRDRQEATSPPQSPEQTVSAPAAEATLQSDITEGQAFSMAEEYLQHMSLEEKTGQLFLVNLTSLTESRTMDGNIYVATREIKDNIKKYGVGGIYLTGNNIGNREQAGELVADLQNAASGGAMYIAAEEEGGGTHSISVQVKDLHASGFTTQSEMGANMTEQQVYETGRTIAKELTSLGVNLNLAPVADIAGENNAEYAARCFSTDKDVVSDMTESIVRGMREGGLAVTLKTFPGIGGVSGETTETIVETGESLMTMRNKNFEPYSSGIEAGADCVLVGNVAVQKVTMNKLPAFMSPDIVNGLLREELGFHGVVLTSPLDDNVIVKNYTVGFAAREALQAGCDILFLPSDFKGAYDSILADVKSGKIDEKVINAAVLRILQNKIQRGILNISNE